MEESSFMQNTLYLECLSGISGDMFVASLLDLGADEAILEEALQSLPISGFQTSIKRVKKSGLDACDFLVTLDRAYENHDHDMEYLHGHEQHQEHTHHQEHLHEHHHEYHHEHRSLCDILHIIDHASISDAAKHLAAKIFQILAEAEAKAHGTTVDQVHFHEVGAVDSIVDIIAAAVCMDNLDIQEVIIPELYEGRGTVRCQHGVLPIPVPAVANIVGKHQLKLHLTNVKGELVTPTGAAIAAAIRTEEQLPEHFYIEKIGLGAGKREYGTAGVVRSMLIRKGI